MSTCIVCKKEMKGKICLNCGYSINMDREPQHIIPGSVIKNRYVIGNAIGQGGFGITYLAWDNMLEQKVAVKEYLPGEFATRLNSSLKVTVYGGEKEEQFNDGLNKFYDESKRLAKFRDVPGIVQIFDCVRENDTAYIIMEYLQGETLGMRLEKTGRLEQSKVEAIFLPILEALTVVHAEGIVHRDISPGNIFLCETGESKLLDFGAARSATGTHSKSLTVLYKEGYTPEEQYRSRGDQGPWTDVYAVAATMYKALTGITPAGAMERRLKDQLKSPAKCGISISKNLDTAIMNALNVDYKSRTQSAADFRNEILSESEVKNRIERTKENAVGRIPRPVLIVSGIILGALIALIILLSTGIVHFRPERFSNIFTAAGKVRVMNVVNMEQDEAAGRLADIGLEMEITDVRYSNDIMEGRIILQDEKKGSIVDEGSTIHVCVSKGAEKIQIPDIIDMALDDARNTLEDMHLKCDVTEIESIYAPQRIADCEPYVGMTVEQGDEVTLYVSKGMDYDPSGETVIGNYEGQTIEDVRATLAGQGIYIVKSEDNYDDNIPKDVIISYTPAEGTTVNAGSVIYANVSMGIEPKEVPGVVDMDRDEAEKVLNDANLTPVVELEIHKELTPNVVIAQSIEENTVVDKYTEVVITVAIDGYDIPNLVGLSQSEAENVCRQNGFTPVIEEVLGGNGTAVSQTPAAGEVVEEQGNITIQIGLSESDFTQKLVAQINSRRSAMGLGALTLSNSWTRCAQILANAGYDSSSYSDWSWAIAQAGISGYTHAWCGTRPRVTTVTDAANRLSYRDEALGHGGHRYVGVAYSGKTVVVISAIGQ